MRGYTLTGLAFAMTMMTLGCLGASGKVKLEGLEDSFGRVSSAEWIQITWTGDGESDVEDLYVVTNVRGFCSLYHEALLGMVDAADAFEVAQDAATELQGDYTAYIQAYCAAYKDYYGAVGDATESIMGEGTHLLVFDLYNMGEEGAERTMPAEGTYRLEGGGDLQYSAQLGYYEDNLYRYYERQFNCDAETYDDMFRYDDDMQYSDFVEWWDVDQGDLIVTDRRGDRWQIELEDARLSDGSGEAAGPIEASATLKLCEIEMDEYPYLAY
jgi:hypothetical protein